MKFKMKTPLLKGMSKPQKISKKPKPPTIGIYEDITDKTNQGKNMNVYNITTAYTHAQPHCVVAENIYEVVRIFYKKYPDSSIEQITLHSEYVLIQE